MKLYYSPGVCSRASHIALAESGLKYEIEALDKATKKTKDGRDFMKLNPKGHVPALELDNKEVLTEGAAIMQWVADQAPEKNLLPKVGTWDRYRAIEWLNYIATDIHKGFSPLWSKDVGAAYKEMVLATMAKRFDYLANSIKGKDWLLGKNFSVCDGYLFTVLSWTKMLNIDMSKWPTLMGYVEKVGARPAVKAVVAAETH